MTLLSGSSQADIDAPIEECWAVVEDIERAPEWQRGSSASTWSSATTQGRALVCDTVTDAKITKVRCRVRVEL